MSQQKVKLVRGYFEALRNGAVARIDDQADKARAAEAAGLSEWDASTLRPLSPTRRMWDTPF